MKIQQIRAMIEPDLHYDGFAKLTVRVYIENYSDNYVTTRREYPIDYMRSIWDMLWEDIGRELKKGLLESEDKKPAS